MPVPTDEATLTLQDARKYRRIKPSATAAIFSGGSVLFENNESAAECQFAEKFLQVFWNEQRFHGGLALTDGRSLEVLNPGTWNVEPGPDFRNAALRISGEAVRGDVEVHRSPADWRRHGHDGDPAYGNVVLHVLWNVPAGQPPAAAGEPPRFELAPHLDRPWHDLARELQATVYPYARRVAPGACAFHLAGREDATLKRLLAAAGTARFLDKAERIGQQGLASGFDQALYGEVFAALGYKVNRDAMRRVAETLPAAEFARIPDRTGREAALLGVAGLLPDASRESVRPDWRPHLAGWWDAWWRLGLVEADVEWAQAPLRPANRPERRLLAGLAWMEKTAFTPGRSCLALAHGAADGRELLRRLWDAFRLSGRWGGGDTGPVNAPQLLGHSRAGDILANAALPFLYAASRHLGDEAAAARALDAFLLLPRLQSNRRLAEAAHRLLVPPSRIRDVVTRAAEQQGLLEIQRAFCAAAAGCAVCPFRAALGDEG